MHILIDGRQIELDRVFAVNNLVNIVQSYAHCVEYEKKCYHYKMNGYSNSEDMNFTCKIESNAAFLYQDDSLFLNSLNSDVKSECHPCLNKNFNLTISSPMERSYLKECLEYSFMFSLKYQ